MTKSPQHAKHIDLRGMANYCAFSDFNCHDRPIDAFPMYRAWTYGDYILRESRELDVPVIAAPVWACQSHR